MYLFLYGCGGGGGTSGGPSTVDITGSWNIFHTENGIEIGPDGLGVSTQTGESITGEITWTSPRTATVFATYTGTISGLDITLSWTQAGTTTTLTGTVSADGTKMSGAWSSSIGPSGTWRATKNVIIAA